MENRRQPDKAFFGKGTVVRHGRLRPRKDGAILDHPGVHGGEFAYAESEFALSLTQNSMCEIKVLQDAA